MVMERGNADGGLRQLQENIMLRGLCVFQNPNNKDKVLCFCLVVALGWWSRGVRRLSLYCPVLSSFVWVSLFIPHGWMVVLRKTRVKKSWLVG